MVIGNWCGATVLLSALDWWSVWRNVGDDVEVIPTGGLGGGDRRSQLSAIGGSGFGLGGFFLFGLFLFAFFADLVGSGDTGFPFVFGNVENLADALRGCVEVDGVVAEFDYVR